MTSPLADAIKALADGEGSRTNKALPAARPATPIPARAGSGAQRTLSTPSGGGIASPLTETAYADRTFYADHVLTSTDGFFAQVWQPVHEIKFTDASNAPVSIVLKAPPA